MSSSILLLSPDVITEQMAGPAIRYWEFAKALALSHTVTLATPNVIPETFQQTLPFRMVQHTSENIMELSDCHDIIIFQGYIFDLYPRLRQSDKILIADLYDPVPLEGLEQHQESTPQNLENIDHQIRMMNDQLKFSDYFLCASDRQRDLWLGHLLALGRINPLTYQEIQQRVVTIPFGLPDTTPQRTGPGFRHKFSIGELDFVLLWGGGIWEWFDPLTLIRAIHQLIPRYPNLKLVFLGTQHPNPTIPTMQMQHQAEALAQELGLYNTHVIFQSGWVSYDTLHNHLLDANVGVSAHFDTLETHFSFRTRILSYLWAEKPIITTQGDVLAKEINAYKAGIIVDPKNEKAWEAAIEKLYDSKNYGSYLAGVKQLAGKYRWAQITQPLQILCSHATRSSDMQIDNGIRKSRIWDGEAEYNTLKSHTIELKQQLDIIEKSNSWKITAPMRNMRRWLSHWKKK
jgi:glycosyltransferase involved in cell wall biosynthesis